MDIIKITNPIFLQQNQNYNRLKSDYFANDNQIIIDDNFQKNRIIIGYNLIIIDYKLIIIGRKIQLR